MGHPVYIFLICIICIIHIHLCVFVCISCFEENTLNLIGGWHNIITQNIIGNVSFFSMIEMGTIILP